ncbi:MAG: hypothetical protein ACYDBB_20510 [Armatimonadota bacterium]
MNKKQIQMYFGCQVHETLMSRNLSTSGMGSVIIARKSTSGIIAAAVFLCDQYCLGVKDCFAFADSEAGYRGVLSGIKEHEILETVAPGCAMKYLVELVRWARSIGFEPHPDFRFCKEILQGLPIDNSATFEFGHDGMPMYINGPNDTPQRIEQIRKTLDAYQEKTGIEPQFMIGGPTGIPITIIDGDELPLR